MLQFRVVITNVSDADQRRPTVGRSVTELTWAPSLQFITEHVPKELLACGLVLSDYAWTIDPVSTE